MKSKGISKIIGLLLAVCVTVSAFPLTFAACADTAKVKADSNPKSFNVMDLHYTEPADNTIANPFPDRSPGASSNTRGFAVNNSFGTRIDYMSLGAQAMRSTNGFSVHPAKGSAGDKADFKIDLTQLSDTVTFFNAVVGLDDLGPMWRLDGLGGSVQCFVLADGRVVATSDVLYPGDMQNLSCDIPEGTKELILRTSNADGNNYMDNCDWAEPTLYTSREAFGQVAKSGYSNSNDAGNRTLSAGYAVGMRFSAKEKFSSITLRPIMAGNKIDFNIYKFTYSYERSIQNGTLTSVSAKRSSDGSYVFPLNYAFEPGEYLVVFDGVTKIKGNSSQYGYIYLDGAASHGFVNMDVTFAATADSYFDIVTDEPAATPESHTTSAEKARAKTTYEGYFTDLASFPSTVKIGEDSYTGFPAPDFTEVKREKSTDDKKHSETTNITINHKSGLQFVLTSVFYPDYAAFDWTVYMTNTGSSNSPIVTDFYGCKSFEFEGDNPLIVGNYGEDYDVCAPYTTRVTELSEGDSITFSPNHGRSTDGGFPYYNFEYGDEGALIAVGWSSSWETNFTYKDGKTDFYSKQRTFNSYLTPGEVARTPMTAMVLYDGRDRQRAQNLWRDWFIDCNMYRDDGQTLTDPFVAGVSSRQTSEMQNATEDDQIARINAYKDNGIDISVWWMDAGWYDSKTSDDSDNAGWLYTGNWTPDASRFPTGFKNISDTANAKGVKTLLWFEPERVGMSEQSLVWLNSKTDTAVKLEWLLGYGLDNFRSVFQVPTNYSQLDMGNPDALAWLKERVKTVLQNGGISIYREDCNIEQMDRNYSTLAQMFPDRAGIVENKCVQGHYDYWAYVNEIEGVELLDSCASGGHRLDLESVRYAVALHPVDYCYADMIAKQVANYNLCSWIPFAGANTASDDTVNEYTVRSAYRQALILQYPVTNLKSADFSKLKGLVDDWKTVEGYYYDDIYQLTQENYSKNEWYAYSYVNSEQKTGFAMVYNRDGENTVTSKLIKLKGLNPDDTYKVTFADSSAEYTLTGKELMYRGVNVSLNGVNDTDIIYFAPTDKKARDESGLSEQIKKAQDINLKIYSPLSSFAVYEALYQAKAVEQLGADATDAQVNTAVAALKTAISGLKISSAASKETLVSGLEIIIDSIGEINAKNYELKNILITYAEKIKEQMVAKYSDAAASNDAVLIAAREAYNRFASEEPPVDDVVYGDVDANGTVEATDALWALQAYVGSRQLDDKAFKAADVNLDKEVNTSDALAILQYAVKLRDKLPIA